MVHLYQTEIAEKEEHMSLMEDIKAIVREEEQFSIAELANYLGLVESVPPLKKKMCQNHYNFFFWIQGKNMFSQTEDNGKNIFDSENTEYLQKAICSTVNVEELKGVVKD